MSLIPEELAAVLVCPVDKGTLDENVSASTLVCRDCGRSYPVRDGIPVMLIEEAGSPG